jgi:hypothetical protein
MPQAQNDAAGGKTMAHAQDHGAWKKPCRRMKPSSQAEARFSG